MDTILWLQSFSSPALDAFFKGITFLGEADFYLLTIPILYWLYDKNFILKFCLLFAGTIYLNSIIKENFSLPRPDESVRKIQETGYTFPSCHAMSTTAYWGYLAKRINKPWAYILAAFIVILVSLSRVYLGVHYARDIIGGILISMMLLYLYSAVSESLFLQVSKKTWFLGTLFICVLLFLSHSSYYGPLVIGFLLGILWGYRLDLEYVNWTEKASLVQNMLKITIGIAILFGLRIVIKAFFLDVLDLDKETLLGYLFIDTVRYFILGIWVTFGAPLTFKVLRLQKSDQGYFVRITQ
ncbi:phosphatase PAP2 family protein [Candidatus Formimonas warabiya]|uniref:Phosphatidic acid phosphatase type 2/haloperoxidase domain-containing protein n=1 Tax=Formimonas warabiya TaxID=1761012 RepID=A0A3G1KZN3_FORW1|nr:phosphatase PAP2 family protein [Candidatus Formimonas warabiya]ATW27849.1 hypothetical protein DCMF_26605 [Candidatus Formimonas warabiya]